MQMILMIPMQIFTCSHANDLKDTYENVNFIIQILLKMQMQILMFIANVSCNDEKDAIFLFILQL